MYSGGLYNKRSSSTLEYTLSMVGQEGRIGGEFLREFDPLTLVTQNSLPEILVSHFIVTLRHTYSHIVIDGQQTAIESLIRATPTIISRF